MKAKKVYEALEVNEAISDILKPQSKEDMKKTSWEWVKGDEFEDKIPRVTKDGHEVFLINKFSDKRYKKKGLNMQGVSGLIFIQEVEKGYEHYWQWNMGTWNFDGSLRPFYEWTTPGMTIDPVTPEELEKLPDYEKN